MGLLKNLRRGFRGGPDFSTSHDIVVVLEDTLLTISLPVTDVELVDVSQKTKFPFTKNGWFEANAEQRRQHHFVKVITKYWAYIPTRFTVLFSQLGTLCFSAKIKRILPEKNIDVQCLDSLGKSVVAEYHEFYNSPVIGKDSFLGSNTRIIAETQDYYRKNHPSFSEERIKEQVEFCLESRGHPSILPHQIKRFDNMEWVYYCESDSHSLSRDRMYCLPLNEYYYLCLSFSCYVDWAHKFKFWEGNVEAAEKRIMESVKIDKVNVGLSGHISE